MSLTFPRGFGGGFGDVFDPFGSFGDVTDFGPDLGPATTGLWGPTWSTTRTRRVRRRNRTMRSTFSPTTWGLGGPTTTADVGFTPTGYIDNVDRANINFWRHYDEPCAVNIDEHHDCYTMNVYPSDKVEANTLGIELRDDWLIIRGEETVEVEPTGGEAATTEKRRIRFERSIQMPADVDDTGIRAQLKEGRLCICLPKRTEHATKRIAITGATEQKTIQ